MQYFGWARNAFTSYRMSGTVRNQLNLRRGLTPASLMAAGVEYSTKKRTLPTLRLGGREIGGYSFGKDAEYEHPTPFMIAHNVFTLYMFWNQLRLFALILVPYLPDIQGPLLAFMRLVVSVLSYQVTILDYTTSLRRISVFCEICRLYRDLTP
jgi:hypothetical protein